MSKEVRMNADEAYSISLKNRECDSTLQKILNDIKRACNKGYTLIEYRTVFGDEVIKSLLDLGYRYLEKSGVLGDFYIYITWDKDYKPSCLEHEVTYKDLKF